MIKKMKRFFISLSHACRKVINRRVGGFIVFYNITKDEENEIIREFEQFCGRFNNLHETFPMHLNKIVGIEDAKAKTRENKEKKREFSRKTLLNGSKLFRDCVRNPTHKPEVRTLISIAIGYDLSKSEVELLFASAGKTLKPIDKVDKAYLYILERVNNESTICHIEKYKKEYRHKSLDGIEVKACNDILEMIGVLPKYTLGKHQN